ncbi:hypothetical protein JMJ77_0007510 [Colletotrichum scovillei]|uniref:Uncharacterized protein n=1 Tax=Colletotrichum scovillei TaxID=1209932 RepID=A0A9P7RCZ1_9PEZI|nr:hypothetical protein JMJ77_0007510 [Colletotrichum scovillei]KAG7074486.1 hypothetical protein JMJ76_0010964 [Colletotrichum scovillei]KAG7081610.1 hypothetical protein JMJ78_0003728 [Colletotrichum scovillei]
MYSISELSASNRCDLRPIKDWFVPSRSQPSFAPSIRSFAPRGLLWTADGRHHSEDRRTSRITRLIRFASSTSSLISVQDTLYIALSLFSLSRTVLVSGRPLCRDRIVAKTHLQYGELGPNPSIHPYRTRPVSLRPRKTPKNKKRTQLKKTNLASKTSRVSQGPAGSLCQSLPWYEASTIRTTFTHWHPIHHHRPTLKDAQKNNM